MDPDPYDDGPDARLGTGWLEAGPYHGRRDPADTYVPPAPTIPGTASPGPAREPRPFARAESADGPDWLYAPTVSRYLLNGLVASVLGTVVLGIVLQAMGFLEAIAVETGVTAASVWSLLFVVHVLLGFVLGFVLATMPRSRPLTGILFGATVWLVWGMVALPVWLGQAGSVLDFSQNEAWMLLIAYVAYGFVAGLVAWYMEPRDDLREVRGFRPMATRY